MDVVGFLRREGEPAILRRMMGAAPPVDVPVQVFIRGFTVDEMPQGNTQGLSLAIISNDEIAAAGWPGPPQKTDRLIADGKTRMVQSCETRKRGGAIVRHDLSVTGA